VVTTPQFHLGKSSAGWVFTFNRIALENLMPILGWKGEATEERYRLIIEYGNITDEYGESINGEIFWADNIASDRNTTMRKRPGSTYIGSLEIYPHTNFC
jgi:hypothetical protein